MPEAVVATPTAPTPAAASPAAAPAPAPTPPAPEAAAAQPSPAPAAATPTPAPEAPAKAVEAPAVVESLIGAEPKPDGAVEAPQAKEEAKEAKPDDGAPVYDLKLPDGVEVDAPLMDRAKAIFAEGKVSPEVAQKLVSLQAGAVQKLQQDMANHQIEVWNTTIRGWQKEITEDKTLGGARWQGTKAAIETGLQTVFGVSPTTPANAPERAAHKAFVAALGITGAGSNPAIIRGLHLMVASRSEGRPAPVGGPSVPKKSAADTMYGTKQAAE